MGIIKTGAFLTAAAAAAIAAVTGTLPGVDDGAHSLPSIPVPQVVQSAVAGVTDAAGLSDGYSRAQFGNGWADLDHDHCNTRQEILARDMTGERHAKTTCTVLSGTLHDHYLGRAWRVTNAPHQVQIDHVVALADAWRSGASKWSKAKRVQFANDPFELAAVQARVNEQKSDKGPSEWHPASHSAACWYGKKYKAVKAKYHLSTTRQDAAALATLLHTCR